MFMDVLLDILSALVGGWAVTGSWKWGCRVGRSGCDHPGGSGGHSLTARYRGQSRALEYAAAMRSKRPPHAKKDRRRLLRDPFNDA